MTENDPTTGVDEEGLPDLTGVPVHWHIPYDASDGPDAAVEQEDGRWRYSRSEPSEFKRRIIPAIERERQRDDSDRYAPPPIDDPSRL